MRFTGNIDAKVDQKGRVFVPSSFRKIILQEKEQGLILRRDIFQRCLILYPAEVWDEQVDAITAKTNMFDRNGRNALRQFVAGAEAVSLDSGGRILIPTGRFGRVSTTAIWKRLALRTMYASLVWITP